MGDCDVIISTTICGNSALNEVSKLVAGGVKLATACKQVAADTDAKHGTTTKWESLRKSYQRANKVGHVPKQKTAKKLDVPMVDNSTITTTCTGEALSKEIDLLKQEISAKDARIAELEKHLDAAILEIDKIMSAEAEAYQAPDEKTNKSLNSFGLAKEKVPREILFLCIEKSGNDFQRHAIKSSNLTNKQLLNMSKAVINVKNSKVPPTQEDVDILEAEEVI